MLATSTRNNSIISVKRQGSIWDPADLPDFNKFTPPTTPLNTKSSIVQNPEKVVPNFSKHRTSNTSQFETAYSNRTSASTQESQRSTHCKDEPTTPIAKSLYREEYDNYPSPRSSVRVPQNLHIPERKSPKPHPTYCRSSPQLLAPPKKTPKRLPTFSYCQLESPTKPEVHKAEVATTHKSSIVQQIHRPYGLGQDLADALELADNAREMMANLNKGRQDSVTTVVSNDSSSSLEQKVKQVDAKVALLVPAIEKLTQAVDFLANKLDSLPGSRPGTRGDSSTITAVSGGFTAAWRDHNNGFLSQQQLRRPSQLTTSRRPSAQTSINTPRSVTFTDVSFKRDSVSSSGTDDEAPVREVSELKGSHAPPTQVRSRQMSKWDTETEEDTTDDADSEFESPHNRIYGNRSSPPSIVPPPITTPQSMLPESPKLIKKGLAHRRPTGFPNKKMNLTLPSIPHSPTVPVLQSAPSTPKIGKVPAPIVVPKASYPPRKSSLQPSPSSTEEFHQTTGTGSELISLPGPLPHSEQSDTQPGAPGLNWAWGWPKRATGSNGRPDIENLSLNFPPTPTTPSFPTDTAKKGLESLENQKLTGLLTPPGQSLALPPPRAGWYFFSGRAANPQFLQQLLGTKEAPVLQPAVVWGHIRRYHTEGGNVAVEGSLTECIHGDAWYVPKNEMANVLREWWGGSGDAPGVCGDGFVETGVEIQFAVGDESRGRRRTRWQDGDGKEGDGFVLGRMFVWKGIGGVLTDEDGSLNSDDGGPSVDKIITSHK
jgi:hypothetical protein